MKQVIARLLKQPLQKTAQAVLRWSYKGVAFRIGMCTRRSGIGVTAVCKVGRVAVQNGGTYIGYILQTHKCSLKPLGRNTIHTFFTSFQFKKRATHTQCGINHTHTSC